MQKKQKKSWIIYHVLFWITMFCSFIFDVIGLLPEYPFVFFFSLFYRVFLLACITYINLWYLIPQFYVKKKYIEYCLIHLLLMTGFAFCYQADYRSLSEMFITYKSNPIQFWNNYFLALRYILISSLFYYLKEQFRQKEQINAMRIDYLSTELTLLKAQINPHFLFNTLNNLYALSLKNSAKTPELILKLSDMMEYMLYETDENTVPLEADINNLVNYIEFEKLRKDISEYDIQYRIDEIPKKSFKIAPMLLLSIVENAFKYVHAADHKKSFIQISCRLNENILLFHCENSYSASIQKPGKQMGLINLRRRLALYYPDKHQFTQEKNADIYSIQLSIEL
nr:histidine kinase [uncultured Sediminibacterium sp.]